MENSDVVCGVCGGWWCVPRLLGPNPAVSALADGMSALPAPPASARAVAPAPPASARAAVPASAVSERSERRRPARLNDELVKACAAGHADAVRNLSAGAESATLNEAVLWAAFAGQVKAVQILVHQGADVNCVDRHGRTPLHWAAYLGHDGVFEWLVGQGGDVLQAETRPPGYSALDVLVWRGHMRLLLWLLDSGQKASAGSQVAILHALVVRPQLCRAAAIGHVELASCLLGLGGQLDAPDEHGKTALAHAAERRQLSMCKWLLSKGACPALLSSSALGELLCSAARAGEEATMKIALAAGADANRPGECGLRPLEWALRKSHRQCVKILVEAGADVLAPPAVGGGAPRSALLTALRQWKDPAPLLCDPDAINVASQDIDARGRSLLHHAVRAGSQKWLALLMHEPALQLATDSDDRLPLHDAAAAGAADVVERLLEQIGKVGAESARMAVAEAEDGSGRLAAELVPRFCARRDELQGLLFAMAGTSARRRIVTVHAPRALGLCALGAVLVFILPTLSAAALLRSNTLTAVPSMLWAHTVDGPWPVDTADLVAVTASLSCLALLYLSDGTGDVPWTSALPMLLMQIETLRLVAQPTQDAGPNLSQVEQLEVSGAGMRLGAQLGKAAEDRNADLDAVETMISPGVHKKAGTAAVRRTIAPLHLSTRDRIEVAVQLLSVIQVLGLSLLVEPRAFSSSAVRALSLGSLLFTPTSCIHSGLAIAGASVSLIVLAFITALSLAQQVPKLRAVFPQVPLLWSRAILWLDCLIPLTLGLFFLPSMAFMLQPLGNTDADAAQMASPRDCPPPLFHSLIDSLPMLFVVPATSLWPGLAAPRQMPISLLPSPFALATTRAAHAFSVSLVLIGKRTPAKTASVLVLLALTQGAVCLAVVVNEGVLSPRPRCRASRLVVATAASSGCAVISAILSASSAAELIDLPSHLTLLLGLMLPLIAIIDLRFPSRCAALLEALPALTRSAYFRLGGSGKTMESDFLSGKSAVLDNELSPSDLALAALRAMEVAGVRSFDDFARSHEHYQRVSARTALPHAVCFERVARGQEAMHAKLAVARSLVTAFDGPTLQSPVASTERRASSRGRRSSFSKGVSLPGGGSHSGRQPSLHADAGGGPATGASNGDSLHAHPQKGWDSTAYSWRWSGAYLEEEGTSVSIDNSIQPTTPRSPGHGSQRRSVATEIIDQALKEYFDDGAGTPRGMPEPVFSASQGSDSERRRVGTVVPRPCRGHVQLGGFGLSPKIQSGTSDAKSNSH